MPIPESHCQGQTSGPSAPLLPVPLDLTGFQGYRFRATAGGRGSLWLAMRERAPTMTGPVPMRNALVFVASLLLISDAGAVKAPEYPTQAVRPPASMSPLSAPEVATSAPAPVPQVVTRSPEPLSSTSTRTNSQYLSTFRGVDRTVVASHAASIPTPDEPEPILRGVTLVEGGYRRAYIEDPRTGKVTGYALGDTVGDSRIERIQVDRVVLRHRHEIVQLLLGVQLTPMSSHAPEADTPPTRRADATSLSPSSGRSSAIKSGPGDGQIIGNGQAWLDRLGIPQGALSRAIESALPAQDSSDLDRKRVGPGERSKNGR